MSFVVVDIETTGLSKHYHRITELAAARVVEGQVVARFHSLVNPQQPIPRFITKLTGIDQDMVKGAPTIGRILPAFIDFVGEGTLVAHNATFDHGFIHQNALREGKRFENNRLCTRKLATRLLPELPSKRLEALCMHFGIHNEQAHRAMGDVDATCVVFSKMLGMLCERGIVKLPDIMRFERTSPAKLREQP